MIVVFQNAPSSAVATGVEKEVPPIGPLKEGAKRLTRCWSWYLPEGHGPMLLSPFENVITKCPFDQKSTHTFFTNLILAYFVVNS